VQTPQPMHSVSSMTGRPNLRKRGSGSGSAFETSRANPLRTMNPTEVSPNDEQVSSGTLQVRPPVCSCRHEQMPIAKRSVRLTIAAPGARRGVDLWHGTVACSYR